MELGYSFTPGGNGNWYIFGKEWKNSKSYTNFHESFAPDNPGSEISKLLNSIKISTFIVYLLSKT